tara:strand:- start:8421 stop:8873 length:453 start_codon:yes stop_codon:yes gene_type:complete
MTSRLFIPRIFTVRSALTNFHDKLVNQEIAHKVRKKMVSDLLSSQSEAQLYKFKLKFWDIHNYEYWENECEYHIMNKTGVPYHVMASLVDPAFGVSYLDTHPQELIRIRYLSGYAKEFNMCLYIELTDVGTFFRNSAGLPKLKLDSLVEF